MAKTKKGLRVRLDAVLVDDVEAHRYTRAELTKEIRRVLGGELMLRIESLSLEDHGTENKVAASKSRLLRLLAQARKFNNETVCDANALDAWHYAVDRVLDGASVDDPTERYDDPDRMAQRKFVKEVFRHGRS